MKNFVFVILLFAGVRLQAQHGYELLQTIPTTTSGISTVEVVKSDPSGCIYVLGVFRDSLFLCSGPEEEFAGTFTEYIAKYDPAGNCLWSKIIGAWSGVSSEVRIASNGDICLALNFNDNLYFAGDSIMDQDGAIGLIRLDNNGNLLWMKAITCPTNNYGIALGDIELDASGNIVVGGYSISHIVFSPGDTIFETASRMTGFLAKYDIAGNVIWHNVVMLGSYQSPNYSSLQAVAIDTAGSIAFCGEIVGATTIGSFSFSPAFSAATEMYLAKADNNGNVLWVKAASGSNSQESAKDMTTDNAGNFYITGQCRDFTMDTLYCNTSGTSTELYVAKFNNNGSGLWVVNHSPVASQQEGKSIVVDALGNVYVGARFQRPTINSYDMFFAKYNASGTVLWTDTIKGVDNEDMGTIDLTPQNLLLFGGCIQSQPTYFAGDTLWPPVSDFGVFGIHNNPRGILEGIVFNDINGNGIQDTLEFGLVNNIVVLEPGTRYAVTDQNGYYRFLVDTGVFTLNNVTPVYFVDVAPLSPDSWTDTLHQVEDTISDLDFAVQAIPGIHDLRTTITAVPNPRPGGEQIFYVTVTNAGTADEYNQVLQFHHEDTLAYFSSSPVYDQYSNHIVGWNIDTLLSGTQRQHVVLFDVPADPTLTGTQFISYSDVQPALNDSTPMDNPDTLIQVVTASFDPNHKYNVPQGIGNEGYIFPSVDEIEYTICFQNTGNDTAFTVVLRDTISDLLDICTITMLDASHSYSLAIDDRRVARWTFDQILLPDSSTDQTGSNGFVKYKIKIDSSAVIHDEIANTAFIYFDYNPPVITNTALNTIDTAYHLSTFTLEPVDVVHVFPNPFNDVLAVEYKGVRSPALIKLIDLNGRAVATSPCSGEMSLLNLSGITDGLYFCCLFDENDVLLGVQKVVRLKE